MCFYEIQSCRVDADESLLSVRVGSPSSPAAIDHEIKQLWNLLSNPFDGLSRGSFSTIFDAGFTLRLWCMQPICHVYLVFIQKVVNHRILRVFITNNYFCK